ncbi:hypothetical protein DWF04_015340 [Cereibacter sphaeroides f. sp. denitrificans]
MERTVIIDQLDDCEHDVLVLEPHIWALAFLRPSGYVEVGQLWAPGLWRRDVEALVWLAMSDFIADTAEGKFALDDATAASQRGFIRSISSRN